MKNLPARPDAKVGGLVWFARMVSKMGFGDRPDIQTFFDLYNADEGRPLIPSD